MTIRLPHIAGLDWQPDGQLYSAPTTKEFWDHYYNRVRARVQAIGVSATKKADGWYAVFDPAAVDETTMIAGAAALREEALALQLEDSDRRAAQLKQQEEEREARRIKAQAREEQRAAEQIEAQRLARACLERWGDATDNKAKLRDWLDSERLTQWQIDEITWAVRRTESKAKRWEAEALYLDGGVAWSEDLVEICVRYMTDCDSDRAGKRNSAGWNRPDSSPGHWCCAMLDINRDAAIAKARLLLGTYEHTQLRSVVADYWRQRDQEEAA